MKYYLGIFIITLSAVFFLSGTYLPLGVSNAAFAQPQPPEKPWTGKTANGTIITKEALASILADHEKWLETNGNEGKRANLNLK
jgi:hypothetical protein